MKKLFLVCFLAGSVLSCSTDNDGNTDIQDQILAGTVAGKNFTFQSGQSFFSSGSNQDQINIYVTNELVDCGTSVLDYGLRISAKVPYQVGVYTDINIVTSDSGSTPFNSLGETVEITSVSAMEISGKMKLIKPASVIAPESIFEGTFTVPICE